jgi:hypothetical protein
MHDYFSLVSKYAGSDETEKTKAAFSDVIDGIDGLTTSLTSQSVFALDSEQKQRIATVVDFLVDQRKRTTLQKRLVQDSGVLFSALQLHAEMFALFEKNIRKDFKTIKSRQIDWLLTKPLLDGDILDVNGEGALKWLDDRRALLRQEASVAQLKKLVKESNEFRKMLTSIIQGEEDALIKLDRFTTGLEETKRVLTALRGGE